MSELRKQLWPQREIGEHARDTQQLFDQIPRQVSKVVESYYAANMVLASPITDEKPESIELTNISSLVTPDSPVGCGSHVEFVWKPQYGGCQVLAIHDLTPSTTIKYRMTFRFTYPTRAQGDR